MTGAPTASECTFLHSYLGYPMILRTAAMKATAVRLERKGWGTVEDGASGERIFRLSQAGHEALPPAKGASA